MKQSPLDQNNDPDKKFVGILGGMGAWTDAEFRRLLLVRTDSRIFSPFDENKNIPIVLYSDPTIPKKNDYLIGKGPNPTPYVINALQKLDKDDIKFIVMPCNTIHSEEYLGIITKSIDTPILNIVKVVEKYLSKKYPNEKIGLMATPATIQTKLYHQTFEERGNKSEFITPDDKGIDNIWTVINAVKTGDHNDKNKKEHAKQSALEVTKDLVKKGAQVIIAGCTEIPLVLEKEDFNSKNGLEGVIYINTLEILADATISLAKGEEYYLDCLEECKKSKSISFPKTLPIPILEKDKIGVFDMLECTRYGKEGKGIIATSFKNKLTHLISREDKLNLIKEIGEEITDLKKTSPELSGLELNIIGYPPQLFLSTKDKKTEDAVNRLLFSKGVSNISETKTMIMSPKL